MMNDLVSVIIPIYNLEKDLSYCMDSVLHQSYRIIEVICVDDGSVDNTREILERYAAKDSRVRILTQPNGGQAKARNNGVKAAKGRYITFVDGDDYVAPTYVENLLKVVSKCDGCLAVANYEDLSQEDLHSARFSRTELCSTYSEISMEDLLYKDLVSCCWGRMANREFFEKNPLSQRYYEDVEVGGEYLRTASKIFFLAEPLYFHVRRPGSTVNVVIASERQVFEYVRALARQITVLRDLGVDERAVSYTDALHTSRIFKLALRVRGQESSMRRLHQKCVRKIRDCVRGILLDSRVPIKNKFRLAWLSFSPRTYNFAFQSTLKLEQRIRRLGNLLLENSSEGK